MIPTLTLSLAMMVGGITPPVQIIHSGNPAANITDPINANAGRIEVIVNAPSTDYVCGFIIRIDGGFPVMSPAQNTYNMTDSRWHLVWPDYGNNSGEGGEGQILRIDCHSNGTLESLDYTLNLPAKESKEKAERIYGPHDKKVKGDEGIIAQIRTNPTTSSQVTQGTNRAPRFVGYLLELDNNKKIVLSQKTPIVGEATIPSSGNLSWRLRYQGKKPSTWYREVIRSQNKDNGSAVIENIRP